MHLEEKKSDRVQIYMGWTQYYMVSFCPENVTQKPVYVPPNYTVGLMKDITYNISHLSQKNQ